MTPSEREQVLRDLDETRQNLLRAVEGLSREQLEYREAQGRWSVADCLEHITLVEQGILGFVGQTLQGAPTESKRADLSAEDAILRKKLSESRKIALQAPEMARPTGRWPLANLVPEFEAARRRTRQFAVDTQSDLRNHSFAHPYLGALDCYQWLVMAASHSDRHREQIEKVKASAGFPR